MIYYSDGANIWTDTSNKQIMQDDSPLWVEYVEHLKAGGKGFTLMPTKTIEVPNSISLAQFYSWLQVDGIYDQVKTFIDSLPTTEDNILAKNRFYNAQTVERSNPMFDVFKSQFGVTDEYIDDNFIKWSKR